MKLKILAFMCISSALAACQTQEIKPVQDPTMDTASVQQKVNISDYIWQYQTQLSEVPVTLNFETDSKQLSIQTGCNQLTGTWDSNSSQLKTRLVAGTMKACDTALMQQEQWSNQLFNQATFNYSISAQNPEHPTLQLIDAQGQQFIFSGQITPEAAYQTQAEIIFLEISPQTKACTGVAPQQCLQVREIKYDDQGLKSQVDKDWSYFYDQIQNFQHDPALKQTLRVKRYEIKNPAADQSKYAYVLDLIVESEMANP